MKERSSRPYVLAVLLAFGLVVAACGNDDSDGGGAVGPTTTTSTTVANGSGGDDGVDPNGVLRVGHDIQGAVGGLELDPRLSNTVGEFQLFQLLFSPLLTRDVETGRIVPNLAESFELVDSKTIELTLRPDAVYHDGSAVVAADFAATVETNKANVAERINNFNPLISQIEQVEVVDDRRFIVRMASDTAGAALEMLTGREGMVLPAGAGADFQVDPNGNGPFRFVSMTEGQRIVFEKFPDHFHADEVRLAGVEFVQVAPGQTEATALLAGDIDFITLSNAAYAGVEGRDGFETLVVPSDSGYIYFGMCKAPGAQYEDIRVRQALWHATDKTVINEQVLSGLGSPWTQIWPEGSVYYNEEVGDPYPYDPDRARQLLEDAGVAEGTEFEVMITGAPDFETTALILQQQWAQVGLNVTISTTDDIVGNFFQGRNADATVVHWLRPGIQKVTRMLTEGNIANICSYTDPEIDRFAAEIQAIDETSPEAIAAWKDVGALISEDVLVLGLVWRPHIQGYNADRVGGMSPELMWPFGQGARFDQLYIKSGS